MTDEHIDSQQLTAIVRDLKQFRALLDRADTVIERLCTSAGIVDLPDARREGWELLEELRALQAKPLGENQ